MSREPSVADNPRKVFSPPKITAFPAMFWGPDGKSKVFAKQADVPPGWTPHHPQDAEKTGQEQPTFGEPDYKALYEAELARQAKPDVSAADPPTNSASERPRRPQRLNPVTGE